MPPRAVARVLHEHFVKEEPGRASAAWVAIHLGPAPSRRGIKKVLPISDRLKAELPKMLEEHESVVTALKVDM